MTIFPVLLPCHDLLSITHDSMPVTFLCSAPLISTSLFSPPPPSFRVLAIPLLFYHPNIAPPLPPAFPRAPLIIYCLLLFLPILAVSSARHSPRLSPFHSQFLFRSVCLFISDLRPTSLYTTGILFSFSIFLSFSARYAALILACRVARLHPHFVTLSQCIAPYVIGHLSRSHRTSESCHL